MRQTALHDQAYSIIKSRIVTLFYRPGMYLNEAKISEDLNIGRTPVHMAISRLALEDMIEVIPRKGIIVKPMSLDDIRAIMEARILNESAAAAIACSRANDKDIAELTSLSQEFRSAHDRSGVDMVKLDHRFHVSVAEATNNHVLLQIIRSLLDRSLRFQHIAWSYDSGLGSNTSKEHIEIIDAILQKRPSDAEHAMRDHLTSSLKSIGYQLPMAADGQRAGSTRSV